jgi:hypothetical protein
MRSLDRGALQPGGDSDRAKPKWRCGYRRTMSGTLPVAGKSVLKEHGFRVMTRGHGSGTIRRGRGQGAAMLFMVIERFKDRDAKAVYRRLRDQGRGVPDGLRYVDSWVEASFDRCFQLMECADARLLQQWVVFWGDLVEFEIVPVVPSKDARATIEPLL